MFICRCFVAGGGHSSKIGYLFLTDKAVYFIRRSKPVSFRITMEDVSWSRASDVMITLTDRSLMSLHQITWDNQEETCEDLEKFFDCVDLLKNEENGVKAVQLALQIMCLQRSGKSGTFQFVNSVEDVESYQVVATTVPEELLRHFTNAMGEKYVDGYVCHLGLEKSMNVMGKLYLTSVSLYFIPKLHLFAKAPRRIPFDCITDIVRDTPYLHMGRWAVKSNIGFAIRVEYVVDGVDSVDYYSFFLPRSREEAYEGLMSCMEISYTQKIKGDVDSKIGYTDANLCRHEDLVNLLYPSAALTDVLNSWPNLSPQAEAIAGPWYVKENITLPIGSTQCVVFAFVHQVAWHSALELVEATEFVFGFEDADTVAKGLEQKMECQSSFQGKSMSVQLQLQLAQASLYCFVGRIKAGDTVVNVKVCFTIGLTPTCSISGSEEEIDSSILWGIKLIKQIVESALLVYRVQFQVNVEDLELTRVPLLDIVHHSNSSSESEANEAEGTENIESVFRDMEPVDVESNYSSKSSSLGTPLMPFEVNPPVAKSTVPESEIQALAIFHAIEPQLANGVSIGSIRNPMSIIIINILTFVVGIIIGTTQK